MDNLYQEIFDKLPVASVCHKVITDEDDQVLKFDKTDANKEFRRLYPDLSDFLQKNQSKSEKSDFFSFLAELWQKQEDGVRTFIDQQRNLKFESKILNDSIIITTVTSLGGRESVHPNKEEKTFEGNFASPGSEVDFRIFSEALKHSPVSVMITDDDGTIEYVNDVFTDLSGYTADEVIGKKPGLLKSGLVPPDDYVKLWKTIKTGAVWKGEFINKRSNGELFFEKASIVPVFDPEGINTHFIAVKEDITEKKKCDQELIDIRQKARESEVLKAAFLQNMSHEIRTPMNAILGFSELAKMSDTPDDKRNSYLQIVIESTHRLLGIVDDIMDISKMETNNVVLKKSPIRLPGFLMSLYKSFADATGSRVKMNKPVIEPEFENATVYLDSARLRQVMENLLSNAVKFTKEGNIHFGCLKNNDNIRFYVEDSGVGIAPEMQSLIFQPFYQTDSGATRAFGGNGLGLTIASRIIDKMGSRIMVDSSPGKVLFFILTYG
ncbi:PAS domain-containing sensor histidine kinase [Marinilabilia salmonicolor]|uniref:PAS domain-containing sensor histidine kinase n=1 Tax=Marinilabilia salmonicolor TaxID=989 RepID=UPI000468146C|nr:HAMP domain-containing sensor histidine kinase [Marinilabilia salmonicolor]